MPNGHAQQLSQLQRRGGLGGFQRAFTDIDPSMLVTTGLFNPQPGDPRFEQHQERLRQRTRPTQVSGVPTRFPQFLSQQQQRQRGARAGTLGGREGPIFGGKPTFEFAQFGLPRAGQSLTSQIRTLMGGRFGQRPTPGRPTPQRPLSFGILGQQGPALGGRFGQLGRPFGRLGQRRFGR